MNSKNVNQKLFSDFDPISTEQWEEVIQKDLKGADYEKKLVWKTIDGLKIKPYYRSEDLEELSYLEVNPNEFPYVRGQKTECNNWEIRQGFVAKDPALTNKQIKEALVKGVTSIGIKICRKDIDSRDKFLDIIKGIDFTKIPAHLRTGKASYEFVTYLSEELKKLGAEKKAKGTIGYDPLGHLTCKGSFYQNEDEDFKKLEQLVKEAGTSLPGFKVVGVNGSNFGNAGASVTQELAYALSVGNDYMARLTDQGIPAHIAANSIHFIFSTGNNYFMELAKFRSVRLLWSTILKQYGLSNEQCSAAYIHAETQSFNKTCYDPHVNILRATTECMSAVLGGVDSFQVAPFDAVYTSTSDFSERIARNIQIILKEEAYFNKTVDPGAGSYYIENLTDSIARHAWDFFIKIEGAGGYLEAFKQGIIQSSINEIVEKRKAMVATGREAMLGTNQYPNSEEKINNKIDETNVFESQGPKNFIIAQPLRPIRAAQPFEELRLRTENHHHTPNVFLFTYGNPVMRKARASFSSGFFACAGYKIIDNLGFCSVEEGMEEIKKQNPDIIVACSSDEEYAELAPTIKKHLDKNKLLVVAGAPQCMEELKKKGIEHFIHMRSNMLETLLEFHKLLAIN